MHCRLPSITVREMSLQRLANEATDSLSVCSSVGKLFHVTGPVIAKLQLPVDVRVLVKSRTPVGPDCSCRRPGRVETG